MVEVDDEDLAVANLAGLCRAGDRFDGFVDERRGDYQACMAKCGRLNGAICNSYCDAKIPQRVAMGICTSKGSSGG